MRLIEILRQCKMTPGVGFIVSGTGIIKDRGRERIFVNGVGLLGKNVEAQSGKSMACSLPRERLFTFSSDRSPWQVGTNEVHLGDHHKLQLWVVFVFSDTKFEQEAKKYLNAVPGLRSKSLIEPFAMSVRVGPSVFRRFEKPLSTTRVTTDWR